MPLCSTTLTFGNWLLRALSISERNHNHSTFGVHEGSVLSAEEDGMLDRGNLREAEFTLAYVNSIMTRKRWFSLFTFAGLGGSPLEKLVKPQIGG